MKSFHHEDSDKRSGENDTVDLCEYQVMSLLSRSGVVCAEHVVTDSFSNLPAVLSRLGEGEKVVRPQGGKGRSEERIDAQRLEEYVRSLFPSASKVLILAPREAEKTYRIAVTANRAGTVELLACQRGKKAYTENLFEGAFRSFQINRLVAAVGLKARQAELFKKVIEGALRTFFRYDGFFLSLDAVSLTESGTFEAVAVQMACDDRALYRQSELSQLASESSLPRLLVDAGGPIACMSNGEGLALAAADMVQARGGSAGKVVDIGSDCSPAHVLAGMKMVNDAKVVLLYLFTGLLNGTVAAKRIEECHVQVPVVVVFEGTNAAGARRVFEGGQSSIAAVRSLAEAIEAVIQKGGV